MAIYQQHTVTAAQQPRIASPNDLSPSMRNSSKDSRHDRHLAAPLGSPPSSSPSLQTSQVSLVPSNKPRDVQGHRKSHTSSQPFVFNILKALEPPNTEVHPYTDRFEDGYLTVEMPTRDPRDHSEKREKKGFWSWERAKDHERDRGRDIQRGGDEGTAELAKMIGQQCDAHPICVFLIGYH